MLSRVVSSTREMLPNHWTPRLSPTHLPLYLTSTRHASELTRSLRIAPAEASTLTWSAGLPPHHPSATTAAHLARKNDRGRAISRECTALHAVDERRGRDEAEARRPQGPDDEH